MSKPRAIITPKGEYASATEAAQAFGLSAQGASWKARLQQSGWRYSNEHPLPPRPPRPRGRPRKAPPMCAACDLANMTALARRWYLHALHGGRLRAEDMTILVQWLEIRARREAAKP